MQMIAGGVLLLVCGAATGEHVSASAVSLKSLGALFYLIVFGSLVGFTAYSAVACDHCGKGFNSLLREPDRRRAVGVGPRRENKSQCAC